MKGEWGTKREGEEGEGGRKLVGRGERERQRQRQRKNA